jgi:hypothetical protein
MQLAFRLVHTKYDRQTGRANVELRDTDEDGEMIATATFSLRTVMPLSNRQVEQEILRKARHLLRSAAAAVQRTSHHDRFVN